MRRQNLILSVLSMLLLLTLTSPIFVNNAVTQGEEEMTAGVRIGDWARYGDVIADFDTTDPNTRPSAEDMEAENTVGYENSVLDVYYTEVRFSHTATLKDGAQNRSDLLIDLSTGLGNGTLMFILAGLTAGEAVYPYSQENVPILINETVTRVYGGATRLVNHLNITQSIVVNDDPLTSFHTSVSHYWDRETGILTERNGLFINHTGLYVTSMARSDKIKDTNLWSMKGGGITDGNGVSGFPYGLVLVVLITVMLIVVVVLWQRKKKLKIRKSRLGSKSRRFS